VYTLIAPRIVRKSTWAEGENAAQDRDRRCREQKCVDNESDAQQSIGGDRCCERRCDDRSQRSHDGKPQPPNPHVRARQRDDGRQPRDRDRGHSPAPARRWQGHCHYERGEDQDENEAVGIADPLDELKPGLTARPTREPAHARGI
jgi:hypothetical protein